MNKKKIKEKWQEEFKYYKNIYIYIKEYKKNKKKETIKWNMNR